jgi:hypothetical protein
MPRQTAPQAPGTRAGTQATPTAGRKRATKPAIAAGTGQPTSAADPHAVALAAACRVADIDDPRLPPDPAAPNYFGALVAVAHFEETGDVAPLVAELATGRDVPGKLAALIAAALRARLLLPRSSGRKPRHSPALDAAIAAAHGRELARLQKQGRHPLRTDDDNHAEAARLVLEGAAFRWLRDEWGLKPDFVIRALSNANRAASEDARRLAEHEARNAAAVARIESLAQKSI